jgi:hypothetical protein
MNWPRARRWRRSCGDESCRHGRAGLDLDGLAVLQAAIAQATSRPFIRPSCPDLTRTADADLARVLLLRRPPWALDRVSVHCVRFRPGSNPHAFCFVKHCSLTVFRPPVPTRPDSSLATWAMAPTSSSNGDRRRAVKQPSLGNSSFCHLAGSACQAAGVTLLQRLSTCRRARVAGLVAPPQQASSHN